MVQRAMPRAIDVMPANGSAERPPDDRLQRASSIRYRRLLSPSARSTGSSAFAGDDSGVIKKELMTAAVPIESARPVAEPKPQRVGVLLVNLGTPDTADTKGVRVYLKEFLSDPRVIENQGLFWKLMLNAVILRIRPRRKARDYLKIWNTANNESPLKTITRSQSETLARSIADHDHIEVDWAMRYGNPSIRAGIEALTARGCDRLLVVPLYPQYSAATSATVCDEVFRVLGRMRAQPTLRVTPPYYDDPDYIEALAVSINAHLATLSFQPELIVASFHGIPKAYVDKGDPYYAQCIATMESLRKRMGLDAGKLSLTFQSRFGFDEWLKPYTDQTIAQLAKDGVRRIAVVTPGFSADCLETLEEIAQENAEIFRHHGGEEFAAIPCLNDSEAGMDVIRQLVLRELQGWI
jgi:protoporphyrin/coproporphyrin ferrochelatase